MTETVQFRIQLPVSLRDRFKTICARSNLTMTDKVVTLIQREVDGVGKLQSSATSKIVKLDDDRLIARVVKAADQLGNTAAALGTNLGATLDSFQDRLLQAMPKPLTRSQISDIHDAAAISQSNHNTAMLAKVEKLHEQIALQLKANQREISGVLALRWNLWQAGGIGTVVGVALSFALLRMIIGTSLALTLAVWLSGQNSEWQAAKLIAGEGSILHGAYMAETSALLKTPEFRESYARCVKGAKTRKTGFNCTVRFTLLQEAK